MNHYLWPILTGRRLWFGPAPWVLLLLVMANIGVWRWQTFLKWRRQANLAAGDVGAFTGSHRCDASFGNDPLSTWEQIPDARKMPLVILSGMSQMFTINDRKPGDQTISEEMDDRLAPRGIRVYGLAAPNLCNEEALFLLLSLLQEPKTTPRVFLYAACFDKMRNADLRPGYQTFLKAKPELQAAWKKTAEAYGEKYPLASAKMLKSLEGLQTDEQTDDSFETRVRETAATFVPVVSARKELNAEMQQGLYDLRNAVLRIKNTSKRPIIRARYEMNQEFLQMMIDVCNKAGTRFITYIIPLNVQSENPYVAEEYIEFKDWLRTLTTTRQAPFANLEDLVPAEEWGEWRGGPDFKHFKGAGHRRTAAKLVETFGPWFSAAGAGRAVP